MNKVIRYLILFFFCLLVSLPLAWGADIVLKVIYGLSQDKTLLLGVILGAIVTLIWIRIYRPR